MRITRGEDGTDCEFEFDVLSARIGAAVRLFIEYLDTCSDLLSQVGHAPPRLRRSPTEEAAAKRLAPPQRRSIDKLVSQVMLEVPTLVDEVVESLLPNASYDGFPVAEGDHHPLATEETAAFVQFLGSRGLFSKIDAQFAEFRGDLVAITYIRSQFMQLSRSAPDQVLADSLLPSVVAAFEQFLSALLRTGLAQNPKGLGELAQVPHDKIMQMASKEEIERFLIEQKVASTLTGTPLDWVRGIQKWTKIDIRELGANWNAVQEAVQRRHAIVHNAARVDEAYLLRVPREHAGGSEVGAPLHCSPEYLRGVMENLRVLGIVLAIRWAHHFGKLEPLEVVPNLVDEIYKLESEGRWKAAHMISATSMGLHANDKPFDDVLRVNWWLCQQRLGMQSAQMIDEIRAWAPTKPRLVAARHALLGEDEALATVVRTILGQTKSAPERRAFTRQVIWDEARARSPEVRAAFLGRASSSTSRANRKRRR